METEGVLAEKNFLNSVAERRNGKFQEFARLYLQALALRYWSFEWSQEQRPLTEAERAAIQEHVRRLVAAR